MENSFSSSFEWGNSTGEVETLEHFKGVKSVEMWKKLSDEKFFESPPTDRILQSEFYFKNLKKNQKLVFLSCSFYEDLKSELP